MQTVELACTALIAAMGPKSLAASAPSSWVSHATALLV